ncbi:unnamed protein product [marine sediment metagenome]|uniref:Uncharacterized protein n=1 Tax=marine sediment metagenome TaxID=412755 RepID=X1EZJ8_9ZZZZ
MVSGLDLILYGVSQRTFGKIAGVAMFAGPIPKTGTEPVGSCYAAGCITLGFNAAEKSG